MASDGAPVCLIRGGHDGLRVADEGVACVSIVMRFSVCIALRTHSNSCSCV